MNGKSFIVTLLSILAAILAAGSGLSAQGSKPGNVFGGVVRMDKTVYDFGDILVSDGPVTASFTATNISDKAMVIYNVVSSCGCTDVEWTREPVKPGESGTIKVTYKNDEGGFPFDKNLTVYFSGIKQPVILRLRGESHKKKLSLNQMYNTSFGGLAFKSIDIKGGNLSQNQQKSGEVAVANVGTRPIKVRFANVSEGLSVNISPNPIPANATARMTYTVTADRNHWGKNYYYATPIVNGRACKAVVNDFPEEKKKIAGTEAVFAESNPDLGAGSDRIGIMTITKEDFSSWTREQRDMAASPVADESTFSFGRVKSGSKVSGSFSITNMGKSVLTFYKVDTETSKLKMTSFEDIAAGGKGKLDFSLDTAGLPKGETLMVLTLITNSPLRPVVNLYVTGWID